MKSVKSARLYAYRGAEAVRVEDVSLPEPKTGEVLISVHAAGVNPIDWKIRGGYLARMKLPATMGGDFSGVVEVVGPDVKGFKVGDEVYGQSSVLFGGSGSFAESTIGKVANVAAKPRNFDHTEAGGLPLVGVSALQALTEHLQLTAGQRVLIHGGAGGIGSTAIQLAKYLRARVAATATGNAIGYVKGLGADTVVDYETQKFEDVVGGLDAVFDTVGGETYVRSFKVLKRGGRLVSMLEPPRQDLIKEFGVEALSQFTQVTAERLRKLAKLVDNGALKVHVDKTFPLEQVSAALQHLENQSPKGKVVLKLV
jgi:NADPH:quinone reductase-like Zn-dependent oxidoreductase